MDRSAFSWRLAGASDVPAVAAIAAQVHPDFPEEMSVFAERQLLYPPGSYLLELQGRPAGYFIGHPWHAGRPPALNARLGGIPSEPTTFYFHDLALLPIARGTGAAQAIVARMVAHAQAVGLTQVSLVAVNGSIPFWGRHGFVVENLPALAEKLSAYEDSARLMVRRLPPIKNPPDPRRFRQCSPPASAY